MVTLGKLETLEESESDGVVNHGREYCYFGKTLHGGRHKEFASLLRTCWC